jgi:hypothetical protein
MKIGCQKVNLKFTITHESCCEKTFFQIYRLKTPQLKTGMNAVIYV